MCPDENAIGSQPTRILHLETGRTAYRIRTSSSTYQLLVTDGRDGMRRCAILRGRSGRNGDRVDSQDSSPLIGGMPLFDTPASKWVGHQLEVGTVKTSPVESVEEEPDREGGEALAVPRDLGREPGTTISTAPRRAAWQETRSTSDWSSHLEGWVEIVENAARCLEAVYQKREFFEQVQGNPDLRRRLEVGVGQCALMLKAIGGRMRSGGD